MLSTLGLPFPHTPPALTAPHTPPLPCSSMSEPTWPPPGHYAVFRSCQSDRVLISQSRPGKMSRSHRDNSCFVAAHFPRNRNLANPNLANPNPGALLATGARHPRTARAALHAAASPTTFLAKAGRGEGITSDPERRSSKVGRRGGRIHADDVELPAPKTGQTAFYDRATSLLGSSSKALRS